MEKSNLEQVIFDKLTGRLPLTTEEKECEPVSLADEIHALARAGQVMDSLDAFGTEEGCMRNVALQQRMFHELSCVVLMKLLHRLENVEKAIEKMEGAKEVPAE